MDDEWLGIFQFAVFMLVVLLVPAMGFHVHQLLARAPGEPFSG